MIFKIFIKPLKTAFPDQLQPINKKYVIMAHCHFWSFTSYGTFTPSLLDLIHKTLKHFILKCGLIQQVKSVPYKLKCAAENCIKTWQIFKKYQRCIRCVGSFFFNRIPSMIDEEQLQYGLYNVWDLFSYPIIHSSFLPQKVKLLHSPQIPLCFDPFLAWFWPK